jgi:LuxR family maltose regulon positive regulatory protein
MAGLFSHALTVVEAPMGYGKTTAVREYLAKRDVPVSWQRIFDSSPDSFWQGFARSLGQWDKDCGQSLLQLGLPTDGILLQEALLIIAGADLPASFVLVIDDFHLIETPAIDRFIEVLATSEIPGLHIVLIARYIDLAAAEELALKNILHSIQKDCFELAPPEIVAYYQACGIGISAEDAERLYALTEGWISALYLKLLDFVAEGSFSTTTNIYRLLEKAVFEPLSEETKELLLCLCVFDGFTLEQAFFMTQNENTANLLTDIINRNIFVHFDAKTKVYIVHQLFVKFLAELFAIRPIEYRRTVYQSAAQWCLKNQDYSTATQFFYECGDFDNLLMTLEQDRLHDFTNLKSSLKKYMDQCPIEAKARHPYAMLRYAMHSFVHNDAATYGKTCAEFAATTASDAGLGAERRNTFLGELEFIRSFSAYNDLEKMADFHQKAWQRLGQPTKIYDTSRHWTFASPSVLYLYHRSSGKLEQEVRTLIEIMPRYNSLTNGHGSGAEYVMEAEMHYHRGNFESAAISAYKALYRAQSHQQTSIACCVSFLQIRLAYMQGDYGKISEILQVMREDMTNWKDYQLLHTVGLCEGSLYAALGQAEKIPGWLLAPDLQNIRLSFTVFGAINIVHGRSLLSSGEYLKLVGSEEHFFRITSVFPNLLGQLYSHIHLAAANLRLHRQDKALFHLQQALDLALPDELYMPFVENCDYIGPLLEQFTAPSPQRSHIDRILSLSVLYRQATRKIQTEHFSTPLTKLSGRELEIARLAASGSSNREIGTLLFISENTVKKQLKISFAKLGIHSRALLTQALDRLKV